MIESGETVVKHVAFFGGGLDPADRFGIGNFLYMVDVETGKAIYKRELTAGAPSEPAAVDTDQNGIARHPLHRHRRRSACYKVDSQLARRPTRVGLIGDPTQWAPFAIFDTDGAAPPIFYPPTVLFVASQGRFAIGFGTGDREDLFGDAAADRRAASTSSSTPASPPTRRTPASARRVLTESSFQPIVALDPVRIDRRLPHRSALGHCSRAGCSISTPTNGW